MELATLTSLFLVGGALGVLFLGYHWWTRDKDAQGLNLCCVVAFVIFVMAWIVYSV